MTDFMDSPEFLNLTAPTRGEQLGDQLPVPTVEQTIALLGEHASSDILDLYYDLVFAVGSDAAAAKELYLEPPSVTIALFRKFRSRVDATVQAAYPGYTPKELT